MKKKDEFTEALEAQKPNNIYYKLSLVKQEIGVLSKNAKNPFFKSDYLDLNGILSAVEPLLAKYGLLLTQPILNNRVCTIIYDIETHTPNVRDIKNAYTQIQSELPIPEHLTDPQKLGSCVTYFRRYTLTSLLALNVGGVEKDDDGNHASKPEPMQQDKFQEALKALEGKKITKDWLINNRELSIEQLATLENY